jgi:hypothetical protein
MMGPLGLLSPHPGVSYLFSNSNEHSVSSQNLANGNANPYQQSNPNLHQPPAAYTVPGLPEAEMSGSLWGIANAASGPSGQGMIGGGMPNSVAGGWNSALGDMVLKIDSKLKVRFFFLVQSLFFCIDLGSRFVFV